MKRGEIWWGTLPPPVGSEPGYRRPVLIVQAEGFNQSAIRTVICVAITSNCAFPGLPAMSASGRARLACRSPRS